MTEQDKKPGRRNPGTVARFATLAVTLGVVAACSIDGPDILGDMPDTLPPPPSETTRAALGRIGVAVEEGTPAAGFDTWIRGSAAEGALAGTVLGTLAAGAFGAEFGGAGSPGLADETAIVFAPVGAVLGLAVGAETAVPEAKAADIDAFVEATFVRGQMARLLRDAVVRRAREQADRELVPLDGATGADAGDECPSDVPIDTRLVLEITGYGFMGVGGDDPRVRVLIVAASRLVDTGRCEEVYAHQVVYGGGVRPFSEWAADSGRQVRAEIARGLEALADKIVEEIFLLYLSWDTSRAAGAVFAFGAPTPPSGG